MHFIKLHGAGNDFVFLTGRKEGTKDGLPDQARALCARRTGVGADGLVITELVSVDPAVLDIAVYNADGSVASMCGNALRCAAWRAFQDHGLREMTLIMAGVKHQARVNRDSVSVTAELGPVEMRKVQAVWEGRPVWFDSAFTGTDHVVAVVRDIDTIDAVALGRLVRNHPELDPIGANVNFIQSAGRQQIKIRTYERGVEAETLSCGSGAVASVAIATRRGLVSAGKVTVHNRAGTPLVVRPCSKRDESAFWVSGPVTQVYEGELV